MFGGFPKMENLTFFIKIEGNHKLLPIIKPEILSENSFYVKGELKCRERFSQGHKMIDQDFRPDE